MGGLGRLLLNHGFPKQDRIAVLLAERECCCPLWCRPLIHEPERFFGHFRAGRKRWWQASNLVQHVALALCKLEKHVDELVLNGMMLIHLKQGSSGVHEGFNQSFISCQ